MRIEIKVPEKDPESAKVLIDGKEIPGLQKYSIQQSALGGFPEVILEGLVIEGMDIAIEDSDRVTIIWNREEELAKLDMVNNLDLGLHRHLRVLYMVDGYEATITDDNDQTLRTAFAPSMLDALVALASS